MDTVVLNSPPHQVTVQITHNVTGGGAVQSATIYKTKVTVPGGGTLRNVGTTPYTLINAPGGGKFINIVGISASYKYGTVPYDFAAGGFLEDLIISIGASFSYRIIYSLMNQSNDWNVTLTPTANANDYASSTSNTSVLLTTFGGAGYDASQGDGSLELNILYTIEDINII